MLSRRRMMVQAQEDGMKTWRLIYDGNISEQTKTIEITKDATGIPLSDLGLEEWVCEFKMVTTVSGMLRVDGLMTGFSGTDKDLSADTTLPFSICRTINPIGSQYIVTRKNANNIVQMIEPKVSAIFSSSSNEIDIISFSNSSAGAFFTTDSYLTIYGR